MKDQYYLEMAKKASLKSTHEDHKHGCVITKGNKVIGIGYNVHKTHPRSPHPFHSVHAEFSAALNADFNIKGATVYIFREYKNGVWAISRPCKHCWKFLVNSGVKKVVYSFEGHFKEEML